MPSVKVRRQRGVDLVDDYGCDVSLADNAPNIQAALDDNANKRKVWLPDSGGGFFACSSSLKVNGGQVFAGEGRYISKLSFLHDTDGIVSKLAGTGSGTGNVEISGMYLRGNAPTSLVSTVTRGIWAKDLNHWRMWDMYVENFVRLYVFDAGSWGFATLHAERMYGIATAFPNPVNGYPQYLLHFTSDGARRVQGAWFEGLLYSNLSARGVRYDGDGTTTSFDWNVGANVWAASGMQAILWDDSAKVLVRKTQGVDFDLYALDSGSPVLVQPGATNVKQKNFRFVFHTPPPRSPAQSAWQPNHAYSLGTNVYGSTVTGARIYFTVTTAGTSGGTEPNWITGGNPPTAGATFTDGSVVWTATAGGQNIRLNWVDFYGQACVFMEYGNGNTVKASVGGCFYGVDLQDGPNDIAIPAVQIVDTAVRIGDLAFWPTVKVDNATRSVVRRLVTWSPNSVRPTIIAGAGRALTTVHRSTDMSAITSVGVPTTIPWDETSSGLLTHKLWNDAQREVQVEIDIQVENSAGSHVKATISLQRSLDNAQTFTELASRVIERDGAGATTALYRAPVSMLYTDYAAPGVTADYGDISGIGEVSLDTGELAGADVFKIYYRVQVTLNVGTKVTVYGANNAICRLGSRDVNPP